MCTATCYRPRPVVKLMFQELRRLRHAGQLWAWARCFGAATLSRKSQGKNIDHILSIPCHVLEPCFTMLAYYWPQIIVNFSDFSFKLSLTSLKPKNANLFIICWCVCYFGFIILIISVLIRKTFIKRIGAWKQALSMFVIKHHSVVFAESLWTLLAMHFWDCQLRIN